MKLALSAETFLKLLDIEILSIANHQNNRVFAVYKTELINGLGYFSQSKCYINLVQLRKKTHIRAHQQLRTETVPSCNIFNG
jgi:hypothetical protein